MPQVFKMGPYLVYFWSNEKEPIALPVAATSAAAPALGATSAGGQLKRSRLIQRPRAGLGMK